MKYRRFGSLNWKVSALGFGCMRLPTSDGKPLGSNIDEGESIKMIRHAIDNGVNYIDTAYPYHNGNSEVLVGKALKDGYREKVKLATKSPVWFITEQGDFDKYLDEQLKKLQTDHIDFYLLHGLNRQRWNDIILKFNILERVESAIKDGRIKYIGFSFHDNYDAFKTIVDGYDGWTFCQIQYNYMDVENQAGTRGLKYAASKGLAVVVMEPLLGGKLTNPPKPMEEVFKGFGSKRSPADWGLQWVWNHHEVSVVLSGMSTMGQVEANLKSADSSCIDSLGAEELQFIERVREKYVERTAIPCTGCSYCMPCPNNVDIPKNFKTYNDGFMHDDAATARSAYERFIAEKNRASACIQCRACEEKCPQKISISQWMPKVHYVLGEGKNY